MSPISGREGTSTMRPVSGRGKRLRIERTRGLGDKGTRGHRDTDTTVADGTRTIPEIRPEQDPQLAHSWLSTRTRETRRSTALVREEGRVRSDRSVGFALAAEAPHPTITTQHFIHHCSLSIAPLLDLHDA
jgi:hypothetical protein